MLLGITIYALSHQLATIPESSVYKQKRCRWLPSNSTHSDTVKRDEAARKSMYGPFASFSIGPGKCVGKPLANLETSSSSSAVFQCTKGRLSYYNDATVSSTGYGRVYFHTRSSVIWSRIECSVRTGPIRGLIEYTTLELNSLPSNIFSENWLYSRLYSKFPCSQLISLRYHVHSSLQVGRRWNTNQHTGNPSSIVMPYHRDNLNKLNDWSQTVRIILTSGQISI